MQLGSAGGPRGPGGVCAPRRFLLGENPPLALRADRQAASGGGRRPGNVSQGLDRVADVARLRLLSRLAVPDRAALLVRRAPSVQRPSESAAEPRPGGDSSG